VGSGQDTKVVQPFVRSYQTSSPTGSLSQSVNNNAQNLQNFRSVQDVKIVQHLLTDIGYNPGQVDGVFGEKTSNAIMQFQRTRSDYIEDGRITDSLIKDLRIHASMYAKRKEVQKLLSYLGYDPGRIDGAPHGLTTVAIIAFERHNGIFYGDGRITDDLISNLRKAVSKQNIKKQSSKYTSKSSQSTSKVIINCGEGFVSTPEGSCKPLGL
jgi:peptidoglycan hydrolase-like protein with peptidoglycan-binding domain